MPIPQDDITAPDSLIQSSEAIQDPSGMPYDSLVQQIAKLKQTNDVGLDTIQDGFIDEIADGDVDKYDILLIDAMFVFIILGLIGYLLYRIFRSRWPVIRGKYFYRDYVILIGFTRITSRIAADMRAQGRKVVVVVKGSARAEAEILKKRGAVVMASEEIDMEILTLAGIRNATTCIVCTGSDSENLAIVDLLKEIKFHVYQKTRLRILVHLANIRSVAIMQDFLPPGNEQGSAEVVPFNETQLAAQLMFDLNPPFRYLQGETRTNKVEYICIIGYTSTTLLFLRELCVLHQHEGTQCLRVFMVAKNVKAVMAEIDFVFPFQEHILERIPVELQNSGFNDALKWDAGFMDHIHEIDAAYCFGDDDSEIFLLAQQFHQLLWNKTGRVRRVPVTLCLPEQTRLNSMMSADLIHGKLTFPAAEINFHFVRMVSDTCTVKNLIENSAMSNQLAMVVNYFEAIRSSFGEILKERFRQNFTLPMLQEIESKVIGFRPKTAEPLKELEDAVLGVLLSKTTISQYQAKLHLGISELWESLTERRKQSHRYVVRHIDQKMFFLGKKVLINGLEETPDQKLKRLLPLEHKRWLTEKLCTGFRFGNLPETEKPLSNLLMRTMKIDDCMVPYEQLHADDKKKVEDMYLVLPPLLAIKEILERE